MTAMSATHTFKRGNVVTVFDTTWNGKIIVSGRATILRPIRDVDEQYWLRFHGRNGKPSLGEEYERFVDPAGQADPQAHVKRLNERAA